LASIVLLAGFCRRLSSLVVCNTAGGQAADTPWRASSVTFRYGDILLKSVRFDAVTKMKRDVLDTDIILL